MVPRLDNFVGDRTFLLLDHLGWRKEDLTIFTQPYITWKEDEKFAQLIEVMNAFHVTNDSVER